MNCPRCYGKGRIVCHIGFLDPKTKVADLFPTISPCPDCMSTGILNCCEGEQAQPSDVEPAAG